MSLLRSDGASLSAVYESKKQDTWSLILRNKVKEDVSVWKYFDEYCMLYLKYLFRALTTLDVPSVVAE